MSETSSSDLVNWPVYQDAQRMLGPDFVRILGYFREDGLKAITAIELAMHHEDAAQLVMPAHKLKGESAQLGADQLSLLAEQIEMIARKCVEHRDTPDELVTEVVKLRSLFRTTLSVLEAQSNPLLQRRPGGFSRQALSG